MKFEKIETLIIISILSFVIFPFTGYSEELIWGTEGQGLLISDYENVPLEKRKIAQQINEILGVQYIKVRIRLPVNDELSSDMCTNLRAYYTGDDPNCSSPTAFCYNLDHTAILFEENGWSMFPMFSHAGGPRLEIPIDDNHVQRFVDFVDWFMGRYKEAANIQYVELVNAPYSTWGGTEEQLLELNNKTYERIKSKYPDVKVGTPGFEYFRDTLQNIRGEDHLRFRNYFLENDAKFDFWAFHGYPILGDDTLSDVYPPTKTSLYDKLSGIQGIVELRKEMNEKGWLSREIIDTEHTGILGSGALFDEADDMVNAAYIIQELVLKRSLKISEKNVLDGIICLKMLPRCGSGSTSAAQESGFDGECAWGSLYSDGAATLSVKAVGLLISKLAGLDHMEHISGNFDEENTIWIEKFGNQDRELYVCFKPFVYRKGMLPVLEPTTLSYSIELSHSPSKVEVKDIFGYPIETTSGETIPVSVDNTPQYVEVSY